MLVDLPQSLQWHKEVLLVISDERAKAHLMNEGFLPFLATDKLGATKADLKYMQAGINAVTADLNYVLNILGPPPEPSGMGRVPEPQLPVGVS